MKNLIVRSTSSSKVRCKFDPLNDFLFYKLFGEKGDEVQLLGFLNAVLGKTGDNKFTSVEILEKKELTPEVVGNKSSVLDVRAVLQGKTRINVEVQLRNKGNMNKRSLFYWGREFTTNLKSGQEYQELSNVVAINIVNFDYLDTKGYHSRFRLRDDKERDIILTDALEIHFINMVRYRKLKGKDKLNDPLCRWLAWLNKRSSPEILEEVVKMDAAIQAADERMLYLEEDEAARELAEMRLRISWEEASERGYLRRQAEARQAKFEAKMAKAEAKIANAEAKAEAKIAKAKAKAKETVTKSKLEIAKAEAKAKEAESKSKLEIAMKLKARGLPLDEIADDTGLSLEVIEGI